ncbi:hypothetical protein KC19_8G189900 [Ceratodon purpureus]|uniref:Uncharacterized protein n=1 Tax=Ceratodon purpureus TaxID=3225 RepID=A0A8T0H5J6_CERPU|nr:hypothetical protein KC19_8G189900 [Ceratodon purpureus]
MLLRRLGHDSRPSMFGPFHLRGFADAILHHIKVPVKMVLMFVVAMQCKVIVSHLKFVRSETFCVVT